MQKENVKLIKCTWCKKPKRDYAFKSIGKICEQCIAEYEEKIGFKAPNYSKPSDGKPK